MTIENNDIDECGTGRELPPSYHTSIRQTNGSNTQNMNPVFNLDTINNRNLGNCILCHRCHEEKILQSEQTRKSLNSLVNILDTHVATYEANFITTIGCAVWFGFLYLLYLWIYYTPPPSIIEEQYQKTFANANISEDIQNILLEESKRQMVKDFKKCLLSKL